MFASQQSPIAVDFGSASVKVLQVGFGEKPSLIAAAELPVPDSVQGDAERRSDYLNEHLPPLLRKARFRGKRAVCNLPSAQAFVQHMLVPSNAEDRDGYVKAHLQVQLGCAPGSVVVRSVELAEVVREGQTWREIICFAVPREVVMRQVELLRRCKLDVGGVHTEQHAIIRAFEHLYDRPEAKHVTDLFVDVGWGTTKVAIARGGTLLFAKSVPVGGRHFDRSTAQALKCDVISARGHRLAMSGASAGAGAGGGGSATAVAERPGAGAGGEGSTLPTLASDCPFREHLDSIVEELNMCRRYHAARDPERPVDRVIFLGGEARPAGTIGHVARALGLPARVGDPTRRLKKDDAVTQGVSFQDEQPGWSVACGLCLGVAS